MRLPPRPSALVSLGIALFFSAWWAWGPAPNRRPALVGGNGLYFQYLRLHPEAYPTEPDFSFWLHGIRIGFETIIFMALIWPVGLGLQQVIELRARVPRRIGHCANCGYDLRATPHQCPECGRETEPDGPNSP